jgi:hypothetical protein
MAKMIIRRSSARKMGTVTELSQSVVAGVTKPTVPGSARSRGKSSGHRGCNSGSKVASPYYHIGEEDAGKPNPSQEERTPTSGVVWKEAPVSAIQSVPTAVPTPWH